MAAALDAPLGALFEAALFEVGRTKAGSAISMAFRAARCTSRLMEMEAGGAAVGGRRRRWRLELGDTSWAGAERTEEEA